MFNLIFTAEIGSNWQGNVDVCKYLYDRAKWAGASHVKMQFYPCDELYSKDWEFYEMAKKCELDYDTARILKDYAEEINIGWFASVHTKEDIDFLVDIKAPYIKIKGSQAGDFSLVEYAHKTNKDVMLSIPDGKYYDIYGTYNLYTTLKYPSEWEDINFGILDKFDGFSDHTKGIQASLVAAAYPNIFIFERHFTSYLEDKFGVDETKTPDYCVSIYPHEFKEMVDKISHIKQTIS